MNARQIQQIQQLLRNVAEVDPNDIISNRASQLTVDLELTQKINNLDEHELELIQYAFSKKNTYVFEPGAKHAVNLDTV